MRQKEKKTIKEYLECECCGESILCAEDCRDLDGSIVCVECIRRMKLCEIMELTGIMDEDALYDFLGFQIPTYSDIYSE